MACFLETSRPNPGWPRAADSPECCGIMYDPNLHHFVPRAYLARFGQDAQVRVRWRDKKGGPLEVRAALDFATVALLHPDEITKDLSIETMLQSAAHIAPIPLSRNWSIEIARKPQFLTSDCPVIRHHAHWSTCQCEATEPPPTGCRKTACVSLISCCC